MKHLLNIFRKKQKSITSSYKESDFVGKYRKTTSDEPKTEKSSDVSQNFSPPKHVPTASPGSFLPEKFTAESQSAAAIRSFVLFLNFVKLVGVLCVAFGAGVVLWYVNQQFELFPRILYFWNMLRMELTT